MEIKTATCARLFILTWHRGDRDHAGGSPGWRPVHCTEDGLSPAITPNAGNSGALFLIAGICVRAFPHLVNEKIEKNKYSENIHFLLSRYGTLLSIAGAIMGCAETALQVGICFSNSHILTT